MDYQKILQGIVRINENGNYYFSLPKIPYGSLVPNVLSSLPNDDVYIIVEDIIDAQVNIYLPKISDFNNAWNAKIYILSKTGTGEESYVILNSYSSETYTDWLNVSGNTQKQFGKNTLFVHIVDNNYWLVK